MTTLFLPQEAMTDWLSTVADYNPVTYQLEAIRSRITVAWEPEVLLMGIGVVLIVGVSGMGLTFAALKGRATSS